MRNDWQGQLEKIDDYKWLIPKSFMPGMRVSGLIYADEKLLKDKYYEGQYRKREKWRKLLEKALAEESLLR